MECVWGVGSEPSRAFPRHLKYLQNLLRHLRTCPETSLEPLWNLSTTSSEPLRGLSGTSPGPCRTFADLSGTSPEPLRNLPGTSPESLWNLCRTSIETLQKLVKTSQEPPLQNLWRTCPGPRRNLFMRRKLLLANLESRRHGNQGTGKC